MALVPLPLPEARTYTPADGKAVQDFLHVQRIEVPVKTIRGQLHVRISSAVYNEVAEYSRLADAVRSVDNWAALGDSVTT
jgi:selenocysteine lyase/cysteine desulfurase